MQCNVEKHQQYCNNTEQSIKQFNNKKVSSISPMIIQQSCWHNKQPTIEQYGKNWFSVVLQRHYQLYERGRGRGGKGKQNEKHSEMLRRVVTKHGRVRIITAWSCMSTKCQKVTKAVKETTSTVTTRYMKQFLRTKQSRKVRALQRTMYCSTEELKIDAI